MGNRYDIAQEIVNALKEYSNEITAAVNVSAESCAKTLQKQLKKTSPKNTGTYAQNWKIKKADYSKYRLGKFVVFNADPTYRLTHLLEYGHALKGGTVRVKAIPHIAPAEEAAVKEFAAMVEKDIQKAGKK